MQLPLVSVIMPVYNSENTVRRALDSILAQTYSNYEVIIVDDGSSDSTCQIISEYSSSVEYFHQENAGASAARNKGITQSKGELVAFIDSDDMWYPEKLEIQVNAYLKEPEASIIHTAFDEGFEFKEYLPIKPEDTQAKHNEFVNIFKMPYLRTPTVMVPRRVFDQVGMFDTELLTAEDVDFFLRCSYQQLVLYIPQVLVYVSMNQGSLRDHPHSFLDNIKVINNFVSRHPEFIKAHKPAVSHIKALVFGEYADELCYKGQCVPAMRAAVNSLKNKPSGRVFLLLLKSAVKLFLQPFISKESGLAG